MNNCIDFNILKIPKYKPREYHILNVISTLYEVIEKMQIELYSHRFI